LLSLSNQSFATKMIGLRPIVVALSITKTSMKSLGNNVSKSPGPNCLCTSIAAPIIFEDISFSDIDIK